MSIAIIVIKTKDIV